MASYWQFPSPLPAVQGGRKRPLKKKIEIVGSARDLLLYRLDKKVVFNEV